MLIGAHVSTAGGLHNAVERGVERGCDAIQIFHQSPRAWRPTNFGPDDFAAFNEAFAASRLGSMVIHAVYLINTASPDAEISEKSLASLTARAPARRRDRRRRRRPPRRLAQAGPARRGRRAVRRARPRGAGGVGELPGPVREHRRHDQGPLGRDFDELAMLVEAAGGRRADRRLHRLLSPVRLAASTSSSPSELGRRRRRPRPRGRPRPAALPARQRQRRADGRQPRQARQRRRGRDGRARDRDLPLRAALRGPAGAARDARARQARPRRRRGRAARRTCAQRAASREPRG